MSFYEISNTKNIGDCMVNKKDYDLIKLVIIRLGDMVYNVSWIIGFSLGSYYRDEGSKDYRLLRFLNAFRMEGRQRLSRRTSSMKQNLRHWASRRRISGNTDSPLKERDA